MDLTDAQLEEQVRCECGDVGARVCVHASLLVRACARVCHGGEVIPHQSRACIGGTCLVFGSNADTSFNLCH
jgi:hypothetical protein